MPHPATTFDAALRERMRRHLAAFETRQVGDVGLRAAAVAAVVCRGDDGTASFLITRRASKLRDHAGQWALPGGAIDLGETPGEAALRELREELGVELSAEAILGEMDDYPTRSGFRITPVVIWGGDPCETVPNPDEVSAVYRVPFAELDRPEVPRLRRIPESGRPIISVPILNTEINAPTAAILYQLREVAVWGRGTRVAHFDQPVFAWR